MHSKELREAIDITLDSMGMQGPIKRRDVARRVLMICPRDQWAQADVVESDLAYMQTLVMQRMNIPHSEDFINRHMAALPDDVRAILGKIPRFICITAGGGSGSEHVMAINATKEHWLANIRLKKRVADAAFISLDQSQRIRDMLEHMGADSIADMAKGKVIDMEAAQ